MNRATRDMAELAKRFGLKVVNIRRRSKHTMLIVENQNGDHYAHPFNASGSSMQVGSPEVLSSFKRFARGATHGLKLLKPKS